MVHFKNPIVGPEKKRLPFMSNVTAVIIAYAKIAKTAEIPIIIV
jgi:hypothetical protein